MYHLEFIGNFDKFSAKLINKTTWQSMKHGTIIYNYSKITCYVNIKSLTESTAFYKSFMLNLCVPRTVIICQHTDI